MAQGEGPEFKSQYCKNKTKQRISECIWIKDLKNNVLGKKKGPAVYTIRSQLKLH
jgi:hypothetical protein